MLIELIKTKESDGDWFKIRVDGHTKTCLGIRGEKEVETAKRAEEIFNFYVENKGNDQIIKSFEIL